MGRSGFEPKAWTDGSCHPNPGPGGWAAVVVGLGPIRELSGFVESTTSNRMELVAVIEALNVMPSGSRGIVYTDSQYVARGAMKWLAGWKANGWRTREGKPVKSVDLWKRVGGEVERVGARFVWVRGHSGNPRNERAHDLAESVRRGGELASDR